MSSPKVLEAKAWRSEGHGTLLLENARRARRVWFLMLGATLLCAACLYLAADMLQSHGGSGAQLLSQGGSAAVLLALLGLLPLVGMVYYGRLYAARVERSADHLLVWTRGLFAMKVHDLDVRRVRSITFHDWPVEPGSPISTPWLTLRIAGRRSPILIDLSADLVDRRAIENLRPRPFRN